MTPSDVLNSLSWFLLSAFSSFCSVSSWLSEKHGFTSINRKSTKELDIFREEMCSLDICFLSAGDWTQDVIMLGQGSTSHHVWPVIHYWLVTMFSVLFEFEPRDLVDIFFMEKRELVTIETFWVLWWRFSIICSKRTKGTALNGLKRVLIKQVITIQENYILIYFV